MGLGLRAAIRMYLEGLPKHKCNYLLALLILVSITVIVAKSAIVSLIMVLFGVSLKFNHQGNRRYSSIGGLSCWYSNDQFNSSKTFR